MRGGIAMFHDILHEFVKGSGVFFHQRTADRLQMIQGAGAFSTLKDFK